MNTKTTLIKNAKLILPESVRDDGWLVIRDGLIDDFGQGEYPNNKFDIELDVAGRYLSPGFVDIHVHGGGGADFRDGDETAFLTILRTHLIGGTTSILPTLSSAVRETVLKSLAVYDCMKAKEHTIRGIPHLEGLHLEGPYFAQAQRGAQDESMIHLPCVEEYMTFLDATPNIKRWSIACELEGAFELGETLKTRGITVSIGHSDATASKALEAFDHGYSCVTHLYSCCSMVHRNGPFREGGVVEAAYLKDGMDVEIIADGVHLPTEMLKLIYKIKGPQSIALVTDSIRPGGMCLEEGTVMHDDAEHRREVIVESGVAIMPDRKSFAGSIATSSRLVRTMTKAAGVPLSEAVRMASLTPARIMGLDHITGSIGKGKRADLVILDDDINVKLVMVSGEIAYNEQA